MKLIIVPGTWSWDTSWYRPFSPLGMYLHNRGIDIYEPDGRPFRWSTEVNGTQFWRRWGIGARDADHRDWQTGGHNLYAYIVPPTAPQYRIPADQTNILLHSHGLQPLLYACAEGLEVNSLISVASPIRSDMMEVAKKARKNIKRWLHVHSDDTDRMQWLGEFGDGVIGRVRAHPLADVNHAIPKAGHSGVLYDVAWFDRVWPLWIDWLHQS